ncbi:hypothetical protein ARMGADRAFT_1086884 [Armillaria gallica]|uniref:Uncharacterized protein n=1 Tax=Armillaria gallica TaxID=47427 RepID=A0A2H3CST7_ARMGA|nr:hypothetical protein ARMGADRAFT_1086884 [Armillaria gallica]
MDIEEFAFDSLFRKAWEIVASLLSDRLDRSTISFLSVPKILLLRQTCKTVPRAHKATDSLHVSRLPISHPLDRKLSSDPKKRKCSEWLPKGTIFTGVRLNADPESEAGIAGLDDNGTLHKIRSIDTDLCPVNITGDKTDERTYLDNVGDTQHDHCLQVVFTPTTILIICALSITLYDCTFTRIATYSFGWSDNYWS